MSLINKMLQDLDARGTTRAEGVPPEIKTVAGERRHAPALRIAAFAAAALLLVAGVAAWRGFPLTGGGAAQPDQLPAAVVDPMPGPAPAASAAPAPVPGPAAQEAVHVAEVAPAPAVQPPPLRPAAPEPLPAAAVRAAPAPKPAPKAAPKAVPEPAPERAAKRPAAPAPARAAPPLVVEPQVPGTTSWAVASERARAEQERLAKRWKAEEARLAALPASQRREGERRLREERARAADKAKTEANWLAALKRREAAGGATGAAPEPAPAAARGQGRVETNVQGAENAYRRALASLQDGRGLDAIHSLQQALRMNARHEAARQTLVSLLIENNRGDEAMAQLQQALTLDPRQPALAMLLARLQIERGKSGIEALLRTLPYAAGNGEYHAFLGGALQRQGRLREAAEQYETALRTAPNNAVWWMGLGIALQGEKRNAEAADAFRQARALGTLSPELQAFVERRLGQLGR